MSYVNSLYNDAEVSNFRNKALSRMNIFEIKEEDYFPLWLNKFEYVAKIIEIPEHKMGELFVSMLHVDVKQASDKHFKFIDIYKYSYNFILTEYSFLFHNIPMIKFHRCRFYVRKQYVDESIPKYANNLRNLYDLCDFRKNDESFLCRQFIYGLYNDNVRQYFKNAKYISLEDFVKKSVDFVTSFKIHYYVNQAISLIDTYHKDQEIDFHDWLNKFEYVANLIEVPDDIMVGVLKQMLHFEFRQSVIQKFPNAANLNISYDNLVKLYLSYFQSSSDDELHRTRFMRRNQYEKETLKSYAYNLQKIYNKCNFSDYSQLILCERFYSGIRDNDIKTYLTESLYLSFEEMIDKTFDFLKENQTNYYLNLALSMMGVFKVDRDVPFLTWLKEFDNTVNVIKVPPIIKAKLFLTMLHENIHKLILKIYMCPTLSKLSYENVLAKYRFYLSFGIEKLKLRNTSYENRIQSTACLLSKDPSNLGEIESNCFYLVYLEQRLSHGITKEIHEEKKGAIVNDIPSTSKDEWIEVAKEFERINNINNYLNPAFELMNIFQPEKEGEFYEWLNKFEYVANIVRVPDFKMIEFFNEMVNADTHKSVKEKFSTVKFDELMYNQIINYYLRYYAPSHETDLHRQRFMCRNQYEKETISEYAYNLRKIFDCCDFTYPSDEILRERFFNGIRDDDVKSHLIQFPNISLSQMIEKATEFEKANDITCYLNQANSMMNIYNSQKEGDFHIWLNKFEFIADSVTVPDDFMARFFKKMVDYNLQREIKQKFPSVRYSVLTYEELIHIFLRFFSYSCESDFYRTRFLSRKQYEKETIEKYAESLRNIYDKVEDKSRMDEELRNQFIVGIFDDDIKVHLNTTPSLSFDETVKKAIEFEKTLDISDYLKKALTMMNIFDSKKTDMKYFEWIIEFESVADTIKIPVENMRRLFDKMVDNDVHKCIMEANPTVNFSILSYEQKIGYYFRYFYSIPEDVLYKNHFTARKQYINETIEKYANTLQKLCEKCNYKNAKEKILCKQFIKGILNVNVKSNIIKMPYTSFSELVANAIELEEKYVFKQSKKKFRK